METDPYRTPAKVEAVEWQLAMAEADVKRLLEAAKASSITEAVSKIQRTRAQRADLLDRLGCPGSFNGALLEVRKLRESWLKAHDSRMSEMRANAIGAGVVGALTLLVTATWWAAHYYHIAFAGVLPGGFLVALALALGVWRRRLQQQKLASPSSEEPS